MTDLFEDNQQRAGEDPQAIAAVDKTHGNAPALLTGSSTLPTTGPPPRELQNRPYTRVEQANILYKEGPELPRQSRNEDRPTLWNSFTLKLGNGPDPAGGRMWGLLVNPTALIPLTQPGDIRQDRVRQLVKCVLEGVASHETRGAYSDALEMFLAFCGREGNPTLSAELVASYRVSLVGERRSSSTVGYTWGPSKL
jgi:hypothetical protein